MEGKILVIITVIISVVYFLIGFGYSKCSGDLGEDAPKVFKLLLWPILLIAEGFLSGD